MSEARGRFIAARLLWQTAYLIYSKIMMLSFPAQYLCVVLRPHPTPPHHLANLFINAKIASFSLSLGFFSMVSVDFLLSWLGTRGFSTVIG